ncbi:MAG: hypothetical protein V4504_01475 [Patescibacteria group bacterium]
MRNFLKKYTKYLPSKKFSVLIGTCLGLVLVFFVISYASKVHTYNAKKEAELKTGKLTVNELLQKDTDGDSVADWEEALWGTDKNKKASFNDTPDATYIKNKKADLNIKEPTDQELTETDKFARGFLAAFTALKDAGTVDSQTINNFGSALGQKIATPSLIDQYSMKDLKIDTSGDATKKNKYYKAVSDLFETYKNDGIGNELDIVSNSLTQASSGTSVKPDELILISQAYKDFASKMLLLSVPEDLAQYHLKIINSSNNTGISVEKLTKIATDPVIGLAGLSEYQKYSEELISAAAELETTLPNNDTI